MNLLSSAKARITGFRLWKKTKPAIVQSWTGFTSCDDLPLYVFVDCLLDGKLDSLVITGKASEDELRMLWLNLYSDYCKRSENEEMAAFVLQLGHIEALQTKIAMCKRLLEILFKGENEVFVSCLRDWGYKIKYDTPEQYATELNRTVALLKGEEERLNKMAQALETDSKGKATKADFVNQLAAVSKFMQMPLRLNDKALTVGEWCGYLKMMKVHYEQLQKTQHGR